MYLHVGECVQVLELNGSRLDVAIYSQLVIIEFTNSPLILAIGRAYTFTIFMRRGATCTQTHTHTTCLYLMVSG